MKKLPEGLYRPKYRDAKTNEVKESAILWVRYYRNGKKIRLSTGKSNVKEAVEFRDKCRGTNRPITATLRRTSFEDLAKLVTTDYEVNQNRSLKRIKEAFEHLRSFFVWDLARDIGSDRINEYIGRRRKEGASNATINRELCALRRGFKLAAQADPPKVDHVPFFPRLKERSARKGFFEREDFDSVLAHLPHYLKAPLTVGFITGWRMPSEVLTRQKSHLNLGAGVLRLEPNESKNGEAREFPINAVPELRKVLERQTETTRQLEVKTGRVIPWLFHHNGKPIKDYYRAWHSACESAGLEGKIPHDFRRTAARNLIRAGVPTQVAKLLTGHKTDSVFERYAIVDDKMKRAAVEQLAIILQKDRTKQPPGKVKRLLTGKVLGQSDSGTTGAAEKSA
jgi:integrase